MSEQRHLGALCQRSRAGWEMLLGRLVPPERASTAPLGLRSRTQRPPATHIKNHSVHREPCAESPTAAVQTPANTHTHPSGTAWSTPGIVRDYSKASLSKPAWLCCFAVQMWRHQQQTEHLCSVHSTQHTQGCQKQQELPQLSRAGDGQELGEQQQTPVPTQSTSLLGLC